MNRSTRTRGARRAVLATLVAGPLLTAACTGGSPAGDAGGDRSTPPASSASAAAPGLTGPTAELQGSYQSVISSVLPSVVEIRTESGLGSGVVLDEQGNIVTNAHVVGTATRFQVQFASSATSYPATLVGVYQPSDLAVIHVDGAPELHPATFADSSAVQVGTIVLAMGNPLGLTSSVTDGIVSAVGRTVTEPAEEGSPGATLPDTIQTSASINPGNSGGALVDLRGQVIGIPTLAATDQQLGGGAAPGIGFAIASNTAKRISEQLVQNDGRVLDSDRAALGATVTTVADASGRPAGVGVVAVAPGGPAERAGLRAGDVITTLAGHDVAGAGQLSAALADERVGASVDVGFVRDGGQETVSVILGELTSEG